MNRTDLPSLQPKCYQTTITSILPVTLSPTNARLSSRTASPKLHCSSPVRRELVITVQETWFNQWVQYKDDKTDIRHQTSVPIVQYFKNRSKFPFIENDPVKIDLELLYMHGYLFQASHFLRQRSSLTALHQTSSVPFCLSGCLSIS